MNNDVSPLAAQMYALGADLIQPLAREDLDPDALLRLAQAVSDKLRALKAAPEPIALHTVSATTSRLREELARRAALSKANGGVVGVRTSLDSLDRLLNGLEPGRLYMLAAQPGAGKTFLALQIAGTVACAGHPALYISLENDVVDLEMRTACRLANTSYTLAQRGGLDPAMWDGMVEKLDVLGDRLETISLRSQLPALESLVEAVRARHGRNPSLVVLDYIQAWVKRSGGDDGTDVRERIDCLTPALREMGEKYGCAILAISSQNRAGYANGGMASLKESGDLEYNADAVMSLYKDPKGAEEVVPGQGKRVAVTLSVDKNRAGATASVDLWFNGDRCRLTEREVK